MREILLDITGSWSDEFQSETIVLTFIGGNTLEIRGLPLFLIVKTELGVKDLEKQLTRYLLECKINFRSIYPGHVRNRKNYMISEEISGKSLTGYKRESEKFVKIWYRYEFVGQHIVDFLSDKGEIYEFHRSAVTQFQALTGVGAFDTLTLASRAEESVTRRQCTFNEFQRPAQASLNTCDLPLKIIFLHTETWRGQITEASLRVRGSNSTQVLKVSESYTERRLLQDLLSQLLELNPDFIVGFDLFRRDMSILVDRWNHHGIKFSQSLSRVPHVHARLSSGNIPSKFECPGRVFMDIRYFVQSLDMFKLDDYSLTALCDELDIEPTLPVCELLELVTSKLLLERTVVLKSQIHRARAVDVLSRGNGFLHYLLLHSLTRDECFIPYKIPSDFLLRTKGHKYFWDLKQSKASGTGGHVFHPEAGRRVGCIATLDFSAMYPSVIRTFNLSPDTLLSVSPGFDPAQCEDDTVNKQLLWEDGVTPEDSDWFPEHHVSPNGFAFVSAKVREGYIPRMCAQLLTKREEVKKQMNLETEPRAKQVLDLLQAQLKVAANAIFGLLDSPVSPLCNLAVSASITSYARKFIKQLHQHILSHFSPENLENNDGLACEICYGDTDSLMVELHLSEKLSSGEWQPVSLTDPARCWSVAERLVEYLNRYSGLISGFMRLNLEDVSREILFWSAKKYCKLLIPKPGTQGSKIKTASLATRTEFPFLRKTIVSLLAAIECGQSRVQLKSQCTSRLRLLEAGDVEISDLVQSVKLQKRPEDYSDQRETNVACALLLREKGFTILQGDRIKYLCVKKTSKYPAGVVPLELYMAEKQDLELDLQHYVTTFTSKLTAFLAPVIIPEIEARILFGGKVSRPQTSNRPTKKSKIPTISELME